MEKEKQLRVYKFYDLLNGAFEMKRLVITLNLFFVCLAGYSTEQVCDILIIGKDTIYLSSFPLEQLKISKYPFSYGEYSFPNTACWRGYTATWRIQNDSLFLEKIKSCDFQSPSQKKDIIEFFEENNIKHIERNGLIFANWYSAELVTYDLHYPPIRKKDSKKYLYEKWNKKQKKIFLVIENGIITMNNLKK